MEGLDLFILFFGLLVFLPTIFIVGIKYLTSNKARNMAKKYHMGNIHLHKRYNKKKYF